MKRRRPKGLVKKQREFKEYLTPREVPLVKRRFCLLPLTGRPFKRITALAGSAPLQLFGLDERVAKKEACRCLLALQQLELKKKLERLLLASEVFAELVPLPVQASALPFPLWSVWSWSRLQPLRLQK